MTAGETAPETTPMLALGTRRPTGAGRLLGVPIAAGVLYPHFGLLPSPMIASAAMSLSRVAVIVNALRLKKVPLQVAGIGPSLHEQHSAQPLGSASRRARRSFA